jgi:hypothetical protein
MRIFGISQISLLDHKVKLEVNKLALYYAKSLTNLKQFLVRVPEPAHPTIILTLDGSKLDIQDKIEIENKGT